MNDNSLISVIVGLIAGVVCLAIGAVAMFLFLKYKTKKEKEKEKQDADDLISSAKEKASDIVSNAEDKAKSLLQNAEDKASNILENARNEERNVAEEREAVEQELKTKKADMLSLENKLNQRETAFDQRDLALLERERNLEQKENQVSQKMSEVDRKMQSVTDKEKVADEKLNSILGELEKVSQMTVGDARNEIFRRVESQMSQEIALYQKNKEEEMKEKAEEKAKEILSLAISKYSQEVTTERTVSTISLPTDDMKGRIIGREGRNIRTLEQMLGVDILIDDTPEVISISCFDPIRRETARLALEYLIKDGRIQPGRIEELAEKAKQEVQKSIHEAGINAAFKLGLPRINKDLLDYVGRLKYRTSYTQNALDHSLQVAYLSGIMAAELGLDQNLAKRAGLLHDIGKAADFELDGSHVEIGSRLAKKYGEPDEVINAIESHHGDTEAKYIYSYLVQAADTLSAARPGARNETLENYIKRIEQLENICKEFDGIQTAYAMQSGREVRVMVVPEKVDDLASYRLAREIREKIENEMTYPGQIKVSVVREVRAVEVAK